MTNEVVTYKHNLKPNDLTSIQEFGYELQEDLGKSAANISDRIKNRDAGEIGELLSELDTQIRLTGQEPVDNGGLIDAFKKIFFKGKESLVRSRVQLDGVAVSVDNIANQLKIQADKLAGNNDIAESIIQQNREYELKINEYIEDLRRAKDQQQQRLDSGDEPLDDFERDEIKRSIELMTEREKDLVISRGLAQNSYNSTRLLVSGNRKVVQKLHAAVTNVIPWWKSELNRAAQLNEQDDALTLLEDVGSTTNTMIRTLSDQSHDTSVRIAQASKRSVVDVETLSHASNRLIETIVDVQEIYKTSNSENVEAIKRLESFKDTNKMLSSDNSLKLDLNEEVKR